MLRELAPAKINLMLHVNARRADGYHTLQSLVVRANCADVIEVQHADEFSLAITGPFSEGLEVESNLVMRAAQALQANLKTKKAAAIMLTKNLPVASGMGGGSADAAATLHALMKLWATSLEPTALHNLACSLGADVPVCLHSTPCWMEGVGENITPVKLSPLFLVLVNTGIPLATKEVFDAYPGDYTPSHNMPENFTREWICAAHNDLQKPAISLCPSIQDVLDALVAQKGCIVSRMSGSGATCFGIFPDAIAAHAACQAIHKQHPQWWVKEVQTYE